MHTHKKNHTLIVSTSSIFEATISWSISLSAGCLQYGHVLFIDSHECAHSEWKLCPHGNIMISSSSSYEHRHIPQFASSFAMPELLNSTTGSELRTSLSMESAFSEALSSALFSLPKNQARKPSRRMKNPQNRIIPIRKMATRQYTAPIMNWDTA